MTDQHLMLERFLEFTPDVLYTTGQAHDVARPVCQTLALLGLIYDVDVRAEAGREDNAMDYLVADALVGIASADPLDAARSPHRAVEVARRLRYRMTLVTGLSS